MNESGIYLVDQESTLNTRSRKIRNWFPEEYISEKGVMAKETAIKMGYIKIIDYSRTKNYLEYNMAIIDHATAEIKTSAKMFDFKSVLVANFAFLLRVCLYHLIIVALSTHPGITVIMLMMVEILYTILISMNFFKLRYFVSLHLFFGKLTQSAFLMIFHAVSMIIFFKNGPKSIIQPSLLLQ